MECEIICVCLPQGTWSDCLPKMTVLYENLSTIYSDNVYNCLDGGL